jgi:hypothetical protein
MGVGHKFGSVDFCRVFYRGKNTKKNKTEKNVKK